MENYTISNNLYVTSIEGTIRLLNDLKKVKLNPRKRSARIEKPLKKSA
jgi:hypothetical protein